MSTGGKGNIRYIPAAQIVLNLQLILKLLFEKTRPEFLVIERSH